MAEEERSDQVADGFDFVIIGAGTSGEAAAYYARSRGASVAIVDRDLFGGSCPFWACMPSKALLHAGAVRAHGGGFPWPKASDFRDWMINREKIDYPNDHSHRRGLEKAGATVIKGTARLAGPGRVEVETDGATRTLEGRDVIVSVGSVGKVPPVDGLADAGADVWSNKEATTTRTLPRSIAVLGAGPSGVEIAQIYARFGVPTAIVAPRQLNPTDHPRTSQYLAKWLAKDGVRIHTNARAARVRAHAGADRAHVVELSDGSSVEAHVIQLSVGRTTAPALRTLGLHTIGVSYDGEADVIVPDDRLRIAPHVYAVGDVIGHEISTHLAYYEGEIAARIALGDDVRPDFRAIPRCVYTDPETGAVGLRLDQAAEAGLDAFEETADLAASPRGYVSEADGHVSIVVDRAARTVVGAFIAGVGASEAIHEMVLAVKQSTPLAVLEDTVHAFPTTARVLGGVLAAASRRIQGITP